MIQSMTGFGSSSIEQKGKKFSVEMRTLNSKQLDINLRLPNGYKSIEIPLRKRIGGALGRGKVDVFFTVECTGGEMEGSFNMPLMEAYAKELKGFASKMDLPVNDILRSVLTLPNVTLTDTAVSDDELKLLEKISDEALLNVGEYRKNEGAVLFKDFSNRITLILDCLERVKIFEPDRKERVKTRLKASLENNGAEFKIDENRFEQELIYYLEKLDITEEVVRLKNNCDLFLTELNGPKIEKGKKLNFIGQEIGREINTIGSKANDKDIQALVVQMKDELEKIKEQLLNIL